MYSALCYVHNALHRSFTLITFCLKSQPVHHRVCWLPFFRSSFSFNTSAILFCLSCIFGSSHFFSCQFLPRPSPNRKDQFLVSCMMNMIMMKLMMMKIMLIFMTLKKKTLSQTRWLARHCWYLCTKNKFLRSPFSCIERLC